MAKRVHTRLAEGALLTPAQFLALPAQPDGTVVRVQLDAAAGANARFRFNSASASPYKWEFDGGSELHVLAAVGDNVPGDGTWRDPSGASLGPDLVPPLTGDYDVLHGLDAATSAAGGWLYAELHVMPANTLATGGQAARIRDTTSALMEATPAVQSRLTGAAAGVTLRMKYNAGNGAATIVARWIRARPVRVAGP